MGGHRKRSETQHKTPERRMPKVEIAPQDRLSAVEHLAPRFFREVLDYDYDECAISDDSDLGDFTDLAGSDYEALIEAMFNRFQACYQLDPRQVGSTRIVDLLEFLASRMDP